MTRLSSPSTSTTQPGGTYEQWCEHVRDEIWTGDTPQFAVGMLAGFAGIISSRLACDHPVMYFTGPMGSGKTTSQVIGAGTVANPNEGDGTLFGVSDEIDIARGAGTSVHIDDPTKRPSLASAKKIESLIYGLYGAGVDDLERVDAGTPHRESQGDDERGVRRRVLTIDTTGIEPIEIGRAMAIKSAAKRYYGMPRPIFANQIGSVDDLHDRVRESTKAFVGDRRTRSCTASAGSLASCWLPRRSGNSVNSFRKAAPNNLPVLAGGRRRLERPAPDRQRPGSDRGPGQRGAPAGRVPGRPGVDWAGS